MRIVPIPCLQDNYAYLVICESTKRAAVVDPSEAAPVLAAAAREGVDLVAIWCTHHHYDHTGGNAALVAKLGPIEVTAHATDKGRVPEQTIELEAGNHIQLGDEVHAEVMHVPGHTTGAIAYYLPDVPAVFTGDTLFCAGCGRLFEGTPPMMYASLVNLAGLPAATKVYCGHEYTVKNLQFAREVEPENDAIGNRLRRAEAIRGQGRPTVPSTIGEERATNPFLRVEVLDVMKAARAAEHNAGSAPFEVFAALRRWKDRY